MPHLFSRTQLLIGEAGLQKLQKSHVAVFGVGGVGSYLAEALARSGVGKLTLIDGDRVSLTNINRQLIALQSTVGMEKVQAAKERLLDIAPQLCVQTYSLFFTQENMEEIDFSSFSYVADAIDTVSSKICLIEKTRGAGIPVISCMGAGNKFNPMAFQVADISKTSVCPLARVMRRELKKRGITGVKAVFSTEEAAQPLPGEEGDTKGTAGRPTPGSMSFVPGAAGLLMAAEIVKDLLKEVPQNGT